MLEPLYKATIARNKKTRLILPWKDMTSGHRCAGLRLRNIVSSQTFIDTQSEALTLLEKTL